MNPYAQHLNGRNALEVLRETPARLRAVLNEIGGAGVERPLDSGKWSVREVLCHLADTEIVFGFRLRQAQAQAHHIVQPYDQDDWARAYRAYSTESALDTFVAVRGWNVQFIDAVPEGQFERRLTHPERGEMTFRVLVETMAGHDLNHLRQIEATPAIAQQ